MKITINDFYYNGQHFDTYTCEMPGVSVLDEIPDEKISNHVSESLDDYLKEIENRYKPIFIFVPDKKQIVRIAEGSGDNLTDDDLEVGYVDYIYYEIYAVDNGFPEVDGGMFMLKTPFREAFACTERSVELVLDMAYGDGYLKYLLC